MSVNIRQDADTALRVVGRLNRRVDTRAWIVRPVRLAVDVRLRLWVGAATRQRVTGTVNTDRPCHQRVVGDVARTATSRQVVFTVLRQESHVIET